MYELPKNPYAPWTVVGLKYHKGHEGEPCAAGFLAKGKVKVAEFSDDEHGGEMRVTVVNKDLYAEFLAYVNGLNLKYADDEVFENLRGVPVSAPDEFVITELADIVTETKEMDRLVKTKVLFLLKGEDVKRGFHTFKRADFVARGVHPVDYLVRRYGAGLDVDVIVDMDPGTKKAIVIDIETAKAMTLAKAAA